MNSPHTQDQPPADGGNSQRKRPADGPADDSNVVDDNHVISSTANQCSAEILPTITSHTHPITTPESSVTSSRHEHRSHNGIVGVLPKGWSLHESAYFDAQQVTLQDLHRSRSASADHIDRLKATDNRPRTGVQENPKGVDKSTTECGVCEDLTISPPPQHRHLRRKLTP